MFCENLKKSTKLRTVCFGILDNIYSKIVQACSECKSLEDITLTVTDCKDLSKTIDKFDTSESSNVKYLWFKVKGKNVIIPSDGGFKIPPFLKFGE